MRKKKQPGRLKKWWWKLWPPSPGKTKAFDQKKFVPHKTKMVEGETYYDASKQWEAAKEACKGNPKFAYFLSELYGELEHPLLLKQTQEERHNFEQRQRDRERDWELRKEPMEEAKRRTFVTSITPAQAAQELLVLGAMTPRPQRV